jgi:hypothetical protein
LSFRKADLVETIDHRRIADAALGKDEPDVVELEASLQSKLFLDLAFARLIHRLRARFLVDCTSRSYALGTIIEQPHVLRTFSFRLFLVKSQIPDALLRYLRGVAIGQLTTQR